MRRFIFTGLLSLLISMVAWGQQGITTCLNDVRAAFRSMSSLGADGEVIRVRYSLVTQSRHNGKLVTDHSKVTLVGNNTRMHLKSDRMESYHDRTASVTVIPSRRIVYLGDPDPKELKRQRMEGLSSIQDSLLAVCRVEKCGETGGDRQIVLATVPSAREALKISGITVVLNSERTTAKKITVDYIPRSTVASVEIAFDEINRNFTEKDFSKPMLSMFLDDKGRLLPKYSGYRLIDVRTGK